MKQRHAVLAGICGVFLLGGTAFAVSMAVSNKPAPGELPQRWIPPPPPAWTPPTLVPPATNDPAPQPQAVVEHSAPPKPKPLGPAPSQAPQILCTEGDKAEIRAYVDRVRQFHIDHTNRQIAGIEKRTAETWAGFGGGIPQAAKDSMQLTIQAMEATLASSLQFLDLLEMEAIWQCEAGFDVDIESLHMSQHWVEETLDAYPY